MDADTYLKDRLDDQIEWYEKKSARNQRSYKGLRMAEFVLAAMIPLLSGLVASYPGVNIIVGLVGVVIAVITGALGLYQFETNWIEYRAACERLKAEKYLFLTGTEPYDGDERSRLSSLVARIEATLGGENTVWSQYMRSDGENAQ